MFRNSNLTILGLLLPCLTLVPAHYVHSSCGSVPTFRSSISKSFTFASTTVDLYNKKNASMLEVGGFLFPGDTQQNSIRNFEGLQQIAPYKTRANLNLWEIGGGEVVFVCGYSNMQQQRTEADGTVLHVDPELYFAEEYDDGYPSCAKGTTIGGSGIVRMAYTLKFGPNAAEVIRICPSFLSLIAKQRWKSVLQLQPHWFTKVTRQVRNALNALYKTEMDIASLLEVSILHELTHTDAGGSTVDLASPPQPGAPGITGGGWLHATSLGAEAWRDGEANGFHGLSGWLISQGYMPQKDGTIVKIGAQTTATATATVG